MSASKQYQCAGSKSLSSPTVAEVIERFAPAYWARYAQSITVDQRRALQAILQCRTEALGGHRYVCGCGHEHFAFHSCNHRLCPRCGAADTRAWISKQLGRLLPVPYYMVTFTLPAQLRPVFGGRREAMELLMRCSSQALRELLADTKRCGFHRSGFFGVYQSWTQDMRLHPHVHYIVPAVGLDTKWGLKRPKKATFLVYAEPLAMRLRTLLSNQLHQAGLIHTALFWELVKTDWNASVDRAGSADNAIKYLGQYVRRSVICDRRILAIEADKVRIRIKNRTTKEFESRLLAGVEFVRRYLQHAMPARFHRIRYYGFLHARAKATLQWIHLLLDAHRRLPEQSTPQCEQTVICPHCGSPMMRTNKMSRAPPAQRNQQFFHRIVA